MESFLSRVTEKTFPWASWCHVTPSGLHLTNFSFFLFKKEYLYRRFEFWRQNSSAFSWDEFKLIITNQKKTKVVKIVIDNKKSQNYHFYFKQERYIQIHRYETKIAHLPIYLWHWNSIPIINPAVFWRSVWGRYGLNLSLVYANSYKIWSVWVFCCFLEVGMSLNLSLVYANSYNIWLVWVFCCFLGGRYEVGMAWIDS